MANVIRPKSTPTNKKAQQQRGSMLPLLGKVNTAAEPSHLASVEFKRLSCRHGAKIYSFNKEHGNEQACCNNI